MEFSLEARTARLSVGELADFRIGPREGGDGPQGIWRAQLGTHWHQQLRGELAARDATARFEIPIAADVMHRGWRISLNGRIDQMLVPPVSELALREAPPIILREIKTVLTALPVAEEEARTEYPAYFAQLAAYLALVRIEPAILGNVPADVSIRGELVFVEAGQGLTQTISVAANEQSAFTVQLERLVEFLEARRRSMERLRSLQFRPAFAELRPGQETAQHDLQRALDQHRIVFFEAPTGFGKTGALLEAALRQMQPGRFERLVYLTSKATGQLQVTQQLQAMTSDRGSGVLSWQVRNKREHCVNTEFHCTRETCRYLQDLERRWPSADVSRFYRFENQARDIETLRDAGRASSICPYEITRVALAFHDVWIGDYNYVFSPSSRGLFFQQPGFDPSRSLLIVDEAHNLPSRVADAYSRVFNAGVATLVGEQLHRIRAYAPLASAWDQWTYFLQGLKAADHLEPAAEDDAKHLLDLIAQQLGHAPMDYAEIGAEAAEALWSIPSFLNELEIALPRLWWSPRAGDLNATCLDAATVIGETLRSFGAALLATATLGPEPAFRAACGLDRMDKLELPIPPSAVEAPQKFGSLNRRETRSLFKQLSSGSRLLETEKTLNAESPTLVKAATPWRDQAYNVAVDVRVDTTYQQRSRHYRTTAETVERLCASQSRADLANGNESRAVAVFFSSYLYAEAIVRELEQINSSIRVALQPRQADLVAQRAWAEESLMLTDAMFLVLGSSFAEGVDFLGGRVTAAMVVGPALPEVNAVQRARSEALSDGKAAAFRRVYQIPGIQKVNQALGRLVRAPGQHARILLHCRRFAETSYASLLAREYQFGREIISESDLSDWLTPEPH